MNAVKNSIDMVPVLVKLTVQWVKQMWEKERDTVLWWGRGGQGILP